MEPGTGYRPEVHTTRLLMMMMKMMIWMVVQQATAQYAPGTIMETNCETSRADYNHDFEDGSWGDEIILIIIKYSYLIH